MAVWRPGDALPTLIEWCGPETWSEPKLEGPDVVEEYRRTFDATIDDLVMPDTPIVATMSSGLDSTFVVASLVRHASVKNPIHAFCHSPLPQARRPDGIRGVLDEYPYAQAMERRYPGLIVVHRVVNDECKLALDTSIDFAAVRKLPLINGANHVWFQEINRRARSLGADRVFHGSTGNVSFSHPTGYAAAYYYQRLDFRHLSMLVAEHHRSGGRLRDGIRTQLASPVVRSILGRRQRGSSFGHSDVVGVPDGSLDQAWTGDDRTAFLAMLILDSGLSGTLAPVIGQPASVDPFRGRRLLNLAAAITPLEWRRGPGNRGFARRAMSGRVPDDIRLRTTRGLQSMDAWYAMRGARQRYLSELELINDTPVFGGWIDPEVPKATIEAWPWGQTHPPHPKELDDINRLLTLASFSRFATKHLTSPT
jgi:hypothetical protein